MSMSIALRKRIEEDTVLIDQGEETYVTLAKRHNVEVPVLFRIHQEKLRKMQMEGAENELGALEERIGKRREEFEALDNNYKKKKAVLEEEINRLQEQKRQVKGAFESQGLSWDKGLQILKEVKDLREESEFVKHEIAKHVINLLNFEKEAKQSRSTLHQLKAQISDLRQIIKREEGRFSILIERILSAQDKERKLKNAIEEEKRKLRYRVKRYEDTIQEQKKQKVEVQAEIKKLTDSVKTLTFSVTTLKTEQENLKSEIEEQKQIAADAEQKTKKILKEAEELQKEIEMLELLKIAISTGILSNTVNHPLLGSATPTKMLKKMRLRHIGNKLVLVHD